MSRTARETQQRCGAELLSLTDGRQRFPQENNVYKNVDERYSVNMADGGALEEAPQFLESDESNPCESDSSRRSTFKCGTVRSLCILNTRYSSCINKCANFAILLELIRSISSREI